MKNIIKRGRPRKVEDPVVEEEKIEEVEVKHIEKTICDKCKGRGRISDTVSCDVCEGTGSVK